MIDVLIIGSGGAALSCAIEAKKAGLSVVIASKTPPTWSQTTQAQGGINAAISEDDSVESHVQDTYNASGGIASKQMLHKLCANAKQSIEWLDELGVPFNKTSNCDFSLRGLGGASHKRALFCQDYTGLKIMHTLFDNAGEITQMHNRFVCTLLTSDNSCIGAEFFDINSGEFERVLAKTTVMATGGFGGIYTGFSTNSDIATGDGIAVAKEAGCALSNMEFVQFHPTALKKSKTLISESARGEGGYLLNDKNERFVDELAPRDVVSQAIANEIVQGREVFLDIRHLGKEFIDNFMPQEYKLAKFYEGVDALQELIPITPAAHYSMGGIAVDSNFESSLQNLFAVGECSDSKIHGANRLGGNSLLEIVTFGRLLGQSLAKRVQNIKIQPIEKKSTMQVFYDSFAGSGESVRVLKEALGAVMFEKVGVFKTKKGLHEAQKEVERLAQKAQTCYAGSPKSFTHVLEFINACSVSKEVISAALHRNESVGAHKIGGFND
ncbi:MAG: L-aspartate oxidase [Campylobacterota bacterium]